MSKLESESIKIDFDQDVTNGYTGSGAQEKLTLPILQSSVSENHATIRTPGFEGQPIDEVTGQPGPPTVKNCEDRGGVFKLPQAIPLIKNNTKS